jgi:hypothetical protein
MSLFILFEVGIRFIQPNGMNFVETDSASGRVVARYSSDQPATVHGWYVYVNHEPSLGFVTHCSAPAEFSPETGAFTFTWYGIPIESLSGQVNVCDQYLRSAGGIPDLFNTYFLTNPAAHPTPPPAGYQAVP